MADKPNVVVFFTDQQRFDTTGVHGNPLALTPNFDRAAAFGTHLYNSFTCQPVCGPARASLQTGLYASNTGCFRNGIPLDPQFPTLADHFNQAGYDTGYIGKWHLAGGDPVPEREQGRYQYWLGANILEFVSEPYRTVLYDRSGSEVKLPGYRVDALTDAAIRFIDERKDRPFFLFVSYLEPHHQNHIDDYPPPDGYRERYTGRWTPPDLAALTGTAPQHLGGYYGLVKRLDEAFGRMLDAVKSLGLSDNTIVLYTSDHGCHFKTRNSEYKRSCHESSIRIPTLLTGPGFTGGGRVTELTSLVDLPPTLLDAAGLAVPAEMQGRSILPLVRGPGRGSDRGPDRGPGHRARPGETNEWPDEVYMQISESQVGRAVRTRRWKYGVDAPGRSGGTDPAADAYVEQYLYDLWADPYELNNLCGLASHREVSDVLKSRLKRLMTAAGETEPEISNAPERPSGQKRVSAEDARL